MNRSSFTLIVSVLLFLIVITIGYISSFQYDVEGTEEPQPTPKIMSPTPVATQVVGTIDEIGGQVGYKNATLLLVNNQPVYLTAETRVVDSNSLGIDKKALAVRQVVVVEGIPAEGGLEATKIIVVPIATPSPSLTPTGAATPAPTTAPAI